MNDLAKIIEKMPKTAVLTVGDIMLDTFVYGDVRRISPEGPVPVLSITHESRMLGGAGNVLSNLAGLGVRVELAAVTGNDPAGQAVRDMVTELGADADGLITDQNRPTSLKTRYIAKAQQLLRTDLEKVTPVGEEVSDKVLKRVKQALSSVQAVILSDYGKGVLTPHVIQSIICMAAKQGIPVLVDPKGRDYTIYKGADIVTPNRGELAEATNGLPTDSDTEIVDAARLLLETSGIKAAVVTRSADGMTILRNREEPVHLRTEALEVFDVSGAGDTVIATIAAGLAAGADLVEAAMLANIAGGIVVGKTGTAPVRAAELLNVQNQKEYSLQKDCTGTIAATAREHQAPVLNAEDAAEQIKKWRALGLKTGLTNGCFDILHSGHVHYLRQARGKCDRLIVALNRDSSVKLLKGEGRPINPEDARAAVLAALGSVDMVVLFGAEKEGEDNTASALIGQLRPDLYCKGGDYRAEDIPETKAVEAYGGVVQIMPLYEGYSTTSTIKKMKA